MQLNFFSLFLEKIDFLLFEIHFNHSFFYFCIAVEPGPWELWKLSA